MQLIDKIKKRADEIFKDVVSIRRHIHANPELSFEEEKTSAFVSQRLTELGIPHKKNVSGYGVVGIIEGKNPASKVRALRADMDALPIEEKNDVPYKSKNNGVMHACGHDVHTSSLLGAAQILNELKDEFEGTVKLIFQPAEEKLPGGANLMIQDGVLKNPDVSYISGQHVMPQLPAGTVGFRSGLYMASTDELYIRVKGKGGHGAMPHLNIDPVYISAQMIVALQQLVSRMANPIIPTVLSFGKVIANGATNVIPNEVYIEGTFRTLDERWRSDAHIKMKALAEDLVKAMGGTCEFDIHKGYPFLYNDEKLTAKNKSLAQEYLGKENVIDLDIWMAAEDFAYFSQVLPSCFYRLGTRNEARGIISSVHTPTFDIDEEALKIGVGLMAWVGSN
jgi:amidohydrolase